MAPPAENGIAEDLRDVSELKKEEDVNHIEEAVKDEGAITLYESISYGRGGFRGIIEQPYVFGVAFLASLGGFSFGYDQGVVSLILTMSQFRKAYPETAPGSPGYGFHVGFMTGMLELGAFLGCLVFPKIADIISRKWGLTVAVVVFTIGSIIQTVSQDYGTLVAGRTIGGIGVGTLAMGAPLYISEISPPNLRGSLLVLESISIDVGAVIAYWITYGTKDISGEWSFRLPFILQIVPALGVGIGIHFFPYSPRWLAMKGRNDDCLYALSRLRRLPSHDDRVQLEWKGIITDVKFHSEVMAKQHPGKKGLRLELLEWMDLFKPKYIKRTAVALGMPFFQQFSGVNAFIYYAPTLFSTLGQSTNNSLILSGMVNIFNTAGVVVTLPNMDRFGRRRLAIGGAIGMAIPHIIMSGIVGKYHNSWSSHQGVGWFGVAMVYVFMFTYGLTYGPVGWAMPSEVFPSTRRAKGVGLATAVNWIANFIIGVAVPPMIVSLGFGTYVFFACFCILAAIYAFFCIPETGGKTLEQMDEVFKDNLGSEERELQREIMSNVA